MRINNQEFFGGCFEDINGAFVVINSSIYLWDYLNKNRWCCLNQFNEIIIVSIGEIEAFATKYKIFTDNTIINNIICDNDSFANVYFHYQLMVLLMDII